MALSVAPVRNPTFSGVQAPINPIHITGVTVAHPPTLTNLQKPAAAPKAPAGGGGGGGNPYYAVGGYGGGGGGGGGYAPPVVYAPKLDIAGLNARARAAAEGAVNPYYTKVLNEFLQQQSVQKQQHQTQYDMNIKNLEDTLQQSLEDNTTTRKRTTEDVATNQADINNKADQFQVDSGTQFNTDRLAKAKELSAAGLTGGLAAQQIQNQESTRDLTESRQDEDFQNQRNTQALFKGRTFEDLAKSDVLATNTTSKNKTQEKFNLDSYIQSAQADEANKRNELEKSRLQDVAQNQQQQAKLAFQRWIAGITNPAQRQAAISTYGGLV